jgi:hypothetical protein
MLSSNTPHYSHSQLSCATGYYNFPNINSVMTFDLKQFLACP